MRPAPQAILSICHQGISPSKIKVNQAKLSEHMDHPVNAFISAFWRADNDTIMQHLPKEPSLPPRLHSLSSWIDSLDVTATD